MTFVGTNHYVCVTLITLALSSNSAISVTSLQNPHDLSPNFSTTIFGLMQTIGSSTGYLWVSRIFTINNYLCFRIISPIVVAHFTKERVWSKKTTFMFFINVFSIEFWGWVVLYIPYWRWYSIMYCNHFYIIRKWTCSKMEQNWWRIEWGERSTSVYWIFE